MVLRYRVSETDDGMHGAEGTFTICSFWLVSALVEIGELDEATALCEKLLSYASPLGLYAEEIDPLSGRHLGNFPQAFTHLAMINAIMHIIRAEEAVGHEHLHPRPPATLMVRVGIRRRGRSVQRGSSLDQWSARASTASRWTVGVEDAVVGGGGEDLEIGGDGLDREGRGDRSHGGGDVAHVDEGEDADEVRAFALEFVGERFERRTRRDGVVDEQHSPAGDRGSADAWFVVLVPDVAGLADEARRAGRRPARRRWPAGCHRSRRRR